MYLNQAYKMCGECSRFYNNAQHLGTEGQTSVGLAGVEHLKLSLRANHYAMSALEKEILCDDAKVLNGLTAKQALDACRPCEKSKPLIQLMIDGKYEQ